MADEWLEKFNKEAVPLIEKEYHPSRIIFFGSRTSGCATEDSDIDVIVISEAFRDIPFIRRMSLILKLVRFPIHVDMVCYTPEEFERIKTWSLFIQDVLKTGIDDNLQRSAS